MEFISFILNLSYTVIGLLVALMSGPKSLKINRSPLAIVINIKSFWWARGYMTGARAMAIGNVVLLGKVEDRDLEHEFVHVKQFQRAPLIHPVLYLIELLRKGYRNNMYEDEAYRIAGNIYKEK